MTAAHYKGGHPPGNDLGLHYTALPPIVASCPYSDQLLVTRKFWSPGANRPSQVRSGGQQIDDLLNGVVGAVVGGFELAGRLVMGVGAVVEAAVGERAAEAFVEEQKKQGDLNPLGGETVGVE